MLLNADRGVYKYYAQTSVLEVPGICDLQNFTFSISFSWTKHAGENLATNSISRHMYANKKGNLIS